MKLLSLMLTIIFSQSVYASNMCTELSETESSLQSCNQEAQSLSSQLLKIDREEDRLKSLLSNPFQARQQLRKCDDDVWSAANKIDDIYDRRIPKLKSETKKAREEVREVNGKIAKSVKSWECIIIQEKWAGEQSYMASGATIEQAINNLKRMHSSHYNRKEYKDFEHICLPNVG